MKEQEINTWTNPWVRATILLGIILIIILLSDGIKGYNNRQTEEEQNETLQNFLNFAVENKFAQVCNLDQRVCCDTRVGKCWNVSE